VRRWRLAEVLCHRQQLIRRHFPELHDVFIRVRLQVPSRVVNVKHVGRETNGVAGIVQVTLLHPEKVGLRGTETGLLGKLPGQSSDHFFPAMNTSGWEPKDTFPIKRFAMEQGTAPWSPHREDDLASAVGGLKSPQGIELLIDIQMNLFPHGPVE
jgi:hypothetical protein